MTLATRIGRIGLPVLCYIASSDSVKNGEIEKTVAEAVAGGVTMVQLREKAMPAGELLSLARRIKAITRGRALLLINDRVDVALASEVDGVHLPENGLPTLTTRGLIGKYAVFGRSVHSVDGAVQAGREGAEYVLVGTIFESPSKPEVEPAGAGLVKEISAVVSIPIVAVGGITASKVAEVIEAGAAGIAVISAIGSADDPKAAATELSKALSEAWAARRTASAASA